MGRALDIASGETSGIVRLQAWSEDWQGGMSTLGILGVAPSITPSTRVVSARGSLARGAKVSAGILGVYMALEEEKCLQCGLKTFEK